MRFNCQSLSSLTMLAHFLVLFVLPMIYSTEIGTTNKGRYVHPEIDGIDLCMDMCRKITDDQLRRKCHLNCKGNGEETSLPVCPAGQYYDPDYEDCDDCDSICLYSDTQDDCDWYCPDWIGRQLSDGKSYTSENEILIDSLPDKMSGQDEKKDESETVEETESPRDTSLPVCPAGQYYDPDYEDCYDCDSICLYSDTQDDCDLYCPDWFDESGSGDMDDHEVITEPPLVKSSPGTTTTSVSEAPVLDDRKNQGNDTSPSPSYSYLQSKIQSSDDEGDAPSKQMYVAVFGAGAVMAFIISLMSLMLWAPFRNSVKGVFNRKKRISATLLPYRSPIVRYSRGNLGSPCEHKNFL